jgi:hypothetical protein
LEKKFSKERFWKRKRKEGREGRTNLVLLP